MLCNSSAAAIEILVREDQLAGDRRRGQNVRLASKLVGWDIEIMTSEKTDELIEKAVGAFLKIDGVDNDPTAEKLCRARDPELRRFVGDGDCRP